MNDTPFPLLADKAVEDILERLSGNEDLSDLDFDLVDGVLTLEFDDGSVLILNRQEAARQLWLASPEGPAHFNYDPLKDAWLDDRTEEELFAVLSRILSKQTGLSVVL